MRKSHVIFGVLFLGTSLLFLGCAPQVDIVADTQTFSEIDRILRELPIGNIAFHVPPEMEFEKTYVIPLLLSSIKSVEELEEELRERTKGTPSLQGAEIKISERMEARLTGQNFQIEAIGPEVQLISGEEDTEWNWDVKPVVGGTQILHLTLSLVLTVNGDSVPRVVRTFDREIKVQVTFRQLVEGFFRGNWRWLWVVVLGPLAAWGYRRWKKKKNQAA